MSLDFMLYAVLRVSGLVTALSLTADLFLTGGWEAAVAALAIVAGMAFTLSVVVLLAAGESGSPGTRV
jgi:hypothetical protein